MQSFSTYTHIRANRSKVYKALTTQTGLAGWLTSNCEVDDTTGGLVLFRFDDMIVTMQIEKLIQDREVVWRCVKQQYEVSGVPSYNDWIGTIIEFRLELNSDNTTTVHFIHEGLTPQLPSYQRSMISWTFFIERSLVSYLEDGVGQPA